MSIALPPSAAALTDEDRALVEAARSTIDAVTDAGPDEDGVRTMGAAVRAADGRIFTGVNVYHFTEDYAPSSWLLEQPEPAVPPS